MSSTDAPRISIILATYNAASILQRCLESLRSQTLAQASRSGPALMEVLIADGASSDSTVEIIRAESQRPDTPLAFWDSLKDRGIYDAWNRVIPKARGEWILFLGADDQLVAPDTLERALGPLKSIDSKYRIAYGQVWVTTPEGETLETVGAPWDAAKKRIRHELTIPHQAVFQHRSLFSDHGLFDPTFKITGDYDFLLRELKSRDALFIDMVITKMQIGGISSQLGNTLTNIRELMRSRSNNGLHAPSLPLWLRLARARTRQAIRATLGESASHWIADLYRVSTGKPRIWTRGGVWGKK